VKQEDGSVLLAPLAVHSEKDNKENKAHGKDSKCCSVLQCVVVCC